MSNTSCNESAIRQSTISSRVPITGGTMISPTLIQYENCKKYIGALQPYGLAYKPSPVLPSAQNDDVIAKLREKTKQNFDKTLVTAIRDFFTKNPNATEDQICKEFEKAKANAPKFIFNPNAEVSKALMRGARIADQRQDGIYWSALAQVLSDSRRGTDYIRYISNIDKAVPSGGEVYGNKWSANPELDLLLSEIKDVKVSFDKVNGSVQNTLEEIRSLYAQNRVLPVESEELDHKGNPTGRQKTVLLEVPSGINLKNVQDLPLDQRNAVLERIRSESKPLRTPFDPEILRSSGITNLDLKNYNEVMGRFNTVAADPNLLSTFYTTEESSIKLGLSKPTTETIARINRISTGTLTTNDLDLINNGGFSSQIKALGKESFPTDTPAGLLSKVPGYFNKPTTYIFGAEKAIEGIGHVVGESMAKEMLSANTLLGFNNSAAVTTGLVKPIPPSPGIGLTTTGQPVRDLLRTTATEQIDEGVVIAAKHTGEHYAHALPWIGAVHYGLGISVDRDGLKITDESLIANSFNMTKYLIAGDFDKASKYAGKAAKYGSLANIEILAALGVISGPFSVLLAVGVYFTYEAAEVNKKKKDAQDRRAAARQVNLVESLFEYGVVVRYESLLASISTANDNPKDNLYIQRTGTGSLQRITTTIVEYPFGRRVEDKTQRKVTMYVPVIPINIIDNSTSVIINKDGEQKNSKEIQESKERCECCGPCENGVLVNVTTDPGSLSTRCLEVFNKYGQMAILRGVVAPSAVEAGINYLCNFFGNACFTSDTKVMTPNGEKNINEFSKGDSVIAFDEDGNLIESFVTDIFVHKNESVYSYDFDNGISIKSTPNHPFYTKSGFLEIGNLNIGDSVIDSNGDEIALISVENIGQHIVYNIEVDAHHTYIANGIRVHNKFDPGAAAEAISNRPPESQPIHEPGDNWATPPSNEKWDSSPGRWNVQFICKRRITNPLLPEQTGKGDWTCQLILGRTFMPAINEGPFGTNTSGYESSDLFNEAGIPIPPTQNSSKLEYQSPPYTYVSQPSNPYFFIKSSNIDTYLKSFPYYLTDSEVQIVKSGDLDEIKSYFDTTGKDPNDRNGLKSYHLTLISQRYTEEMEKEERNINERRMYLDCITSITGQ